MEQTSTLKEVVSGLKAGRAYQRTLEGDGGKEYLTPVGHDEFRHDVAGVAHGGWGGSAVLPVSILGNGRWAEDGWEHKDDAALARDPRKDDPFWA